MERHHNDPMAGHYGEEGTFQKIARRYYWTGMRKYISDYINKCPECARFKATNQKPAGLLRTPVYSQRFEVIAIDLFGPLPQTDTVYYSPGDKVWVTLHPISSAKNKKTSKFMPKRDGPYLILTQKSPTSYVIASLANPSEPIATYHTSALTPVKDINTSPVAPLRKRGRPRKVTSTSQNKHVPSPSTATTAVSNRTIHPSTRATTTTANYVSSPGRRRIHRGRL
ncbi:transposon Tf2-6 polyprotein [Trichonephila clavipes]|nr:transposon Tf2-6 polyprotein [Trichonephila clavipes]